MPLAIDPTLDAFSIHIADLRQLSQHTVRAYRADIRAFVAYLIHSQQSSVLTVDAATARAWISHMTKVDGLAKASVARRVASLRTFFSWAIQSGLTESNPFTDVDIPKRGKSLPKALDTADIGALLDSKRDDSPAGLRDKAIVECLYASGIRAGELIGLDVEDVFRTGSDEGALRIRHAKGGQERFALLVPSRPGEHSSSSSSSSNCCCHYPLGLCLLLAHPLQGGIATAILLSEKGQVDSGSQQG
jgi:integrase/recombinase XerC